MCTAAILYDDCHANDIQTLQAVERFDAEVFLQSLQEESFQACGEGPITVTMIAAQRLGANGVRIIGHSTSADVTGRHDGYVVGYGAVAIYRKAEEENDTFLTREGRRQLLEIARNSVVDTVKRSYEATPPQADTIVSGRLHEAGGASVTIRQQGALRGCIGRVQPSDALYRTVYQVAQAAAFQDPRYPPISREELEGLTVSLSALGPLMPLDTKKDLTIGDHGLYISRDAMSGLLLPHVASSRGWDGEAFLAQTCEKAGLPPDAWKDEKTEVMYFDAEVFGEKEGED
ncbi:MAG: AmmeMemoRadiSam system protein A [Gemmatimonadota bacterium]|nr:AmmeMemoRadiSam system protein A [Gemmatimonadota bacterium]